MTVSPALHIRISALNYPILVKIVSVVRASFVFSNESLIFVLYIQPRRRTSKLVKLI